MKRFFTKKSIALILAIIIVSGLFSFKFAFAANSPQWTDPKTSIRYVYIPLNEKYGFFNQKGTNVWHEVKEGGRDLTTDEMVQLGLENAAKLVDDYNVSKGIQTEKEGWARFWQMIENSTGFMKDVTIDFVVTILEFVTIPIASFCMAISGVILDYSIQYSIYGEGFKVMETTIQSVWVLIRDTANIFFIFVLLYAAIQQIIYGSASKDTLKNIIVAAFLINFSLFATRIVVDASNIVATSIYNQITLTTESTTAATQKLFTPTKIITDTTQEVVPQQAGYAGVNILQIDLSGRIMDGLNLTGISNNSSLSGSPSGVTGIAALLSTVIKLILYLVTTYLFVLLAGILIGRLVMLVFLMATSPIGFVGDVVPGLSEHSKNWRKNLMDQALIAPLFMFFMLLIIRISQALPISKIDNPMVVAFNFFFVVYMLLKSVKILKGYAGEMGDIAGKLASSATGLALGATTGGTALLARQTVGRVAAGAIRDFGATLEQRGAKGGAMGTLAKMTSSGLKGTANATFDARNTSTFKEVYSQAKGFAGGTDLVDADSLKAGGAYKNVKETGFAGSQASKTKEVEEKAKKYAESAEKTDKADKKKIEDFDKKIAELEGRMLLETDPKKKTELQNQIQELEFRKRDETSFGIETKVKQRAEDISRRDTGKGMGVAIEEKEEKINKVKRDDFAGDSSIMKIEAERKKLEDELKKGRANMFDDQIASVEKQIKDKEEEIKKRGDELVDAEKKKLDKELKTLKVLEEDILKEARESTEFGILNDKNQNSLHQFLINRAKMKKNYAKSQRDFILNLLRLVTPEEGEALSKAAENVKYSEDNAKDEAMKKKILKDLQDEMKKNP